MLSYEIVKPSSDYRDSYVESLQEGLRSITLAADRIEWIQTNFEEFLNEEEDLSSRPEWWQTSSTPIELPDGKIVKRVPCTTLWLVSGNRFIGEVAIRHMLTPELERVGGNIGYNVRLTERKKGHGKKLLQVGLNEAKKVGLAEVLITCDDDNIGSIKIIESVGVQLKDKLKRPGCTTLHRRYIVKLK